MKLLNLDSGDEAATPNKKKSKWLKIGIGLSALVLIPTIGSTLAGTINIGSGSVEFGQGLVTTAACDDEINLAPTSIINTSVPQSFEISAITFSLISEECAGKTFRLRAQDELGLPVALCFVTDYADIVYNGMSGATTICGGITDFEGGFDFNPDQQVFSGDIASFTIESLETAL